MSASNLPMSNMAKSPTRRPVSSEKARQTEIQNLRSGQIKWIGGRDAVRLATTSVSS